VKKSINNNKYLRFKNGPNQKCSGLKFECFIKGHTYFFPICYDCMNRLGNVNSKWIAFIHRLTILLHIHPFIHRPRCQPCKVTTNTSGAVRVIGYRCLAHGHLDTGLGGAGDRTSNLPVARQLLFLLLSHYRPCIITSLFADDFRKTVFHGNSKHGLSLKCLPKVQIRAITHTQLDLRCACVNALATSADSGGPVLQPVSHTIQALCTLAGEETSGGHQTDNYPDHTHAV